MYIYLVSGYEIKPKPHSWPIRAFITKKDAENFIANLIKNYPNNADDYNITLIDLVCPKTYKDWLIDNAKDWSGLQEDL